MIKLMDSYCLADIHCQYMPQQIFHFDFELMWSTGIFVKVYAEMITDKGKCRGKPQDAD